MPIVPIHAVIYDLDGTVADTQGIHADIERILLAEHGIHMDPEELTENYAGVSLQETFRAIFEKHGKQCPDLDQMSERKVRMLHARASEFRPMPGIMAQTAMLKDRGIKLAVATASRLVTANLVLERLTIRSRFDAIASTKECENGKPAPDVFLLAARRINTAPRNCLVIGDGAADMLGAQAAGMRCIALWKHKPRKLPAELVVSDLRQIPDSFF